MDKDSVSIEKEIQKVLSEQIIPFIEAHAGNIEFVSFHDGIVKVRMSGACKGCPLSQLTLKGLVEKTLKEHVHGVVVVETVA